MSTENQNKGIAMRVTYYVACSLDGHIAQEDGSVSWLDDIGISQEESGYDDFFLTVDALMMGRKTYESISGFGCWPYGNKPVWVCSSRDITPIEGANLQKPLPPSHVVEVADNAGLTHVWVVGGGVLAASLMNDSLLTDIRVVQIPILLGSGIPLFNGLADLTRVHLKSCQTNTSGFCQLNYVIEQMN